MIESIKKPFVMIYTNHFVVIFISRQISLIILSIDKFNLRLVRTSQYLFIFDLTIRYKADKTNIVFDVLSRL